MVESKQVKRTCLPRSTKSDSCFLLYRSWDGSGTTVKGSLFLALGRPGSADGLKEDNTTRKCMEIAEAMGYNSVTMAFLFPPRTKSWKDTLGHDSPTGHPLSTSWIASTASNADIRVACWGDSCHHFNRDVEIWGRVRPMDCFGLTKRGNPISIDKVDVSNLFKRRFYFDPSKRDLSSVIGSRTHG